jgi:CRP-like cAMP-binding protein
LLAALPRHEFDQLYSSLQLISLRRGEVLFDIAEPVAEAYFINSGMVSLLSVMADGETVEAAMVGSEGLVGTAALLSINRTSWRAQVQLPATAFKIKAETLRIHSERSFRLRDLSLRFEQTILTQLSQNVACHVYHSIEQRLARWLLVIYDRAESNSFTATHEDIAATLGISRSVVSTAAGLLQRRDLIDYSRGRITLLDRAGLAGISCECYRLIREDLDLYLPQKPTSEAPRYVVNRHSRKPTDKLLFPC